MGSVIISPFIDAKLLDFCVNAGLNTKIIISNSLSLKIGASLCVPIGYTVTLEPAFHINNKISNNFLNPDGKKGTITFKPSFKFLQIDDAAFSDKERSFTYSLNVLAPVSSKLTCKIALKSHKIITYDEYDIKYFTLYAGLNIYPGF